MLKNFQPSSFVQILVSLPSLFCYSATLLYKTSILQGQMTCVQISGSKIYGKVTLVFVCFIPIMFYALSHKRTPTMESTNEMA